MLARFPGLDHVLDLGNAPGLLTSLRAMAPTWQPSAIPEAPADVLPDGRPMPKTSVWHGEGGYVLKPHWRRKPMRRLGTASAVCGIIADVCQAYCDQRPGTLALHCGAFELHGRLIALTGPFRAGKSTLIARMACDSDVSIYCDDVLPLTEDGRAVALGLAPRLRLPVPDGLREPLGKASHVEPGPGDHRYGYILTPSLADHGTVGDLSAIFVLDRSSGQRSGVYRVSHEETIAHLIRQNIADPGDPLDHVDRVAEMARAIPCLKLVYRDVEDAARLLRQYCATAGEAFPTAEGATVPPSPAEGGPIALPASRRYVQADEVQLRETGTAAVLWHPARRHYFQLNNIARLVWSLLDEPRTHRNVVEQFEVLFPWVPRTQLKHDIEALMADMSESGVIEAA